MVTNTRIDVGRRQSPTRTPHRLRFRANHGRFRALLFLLGSTLLLLLFADHVLAQAVQLPSFQFFTVNTTVSVPDRGAAYLGGVSRAASGSVSRGIPLVGKLPGVGRLGRGDAIGSSVGASDATVSATIIDLNELDKAVLAEARAKRGDVAAAPAVTHKTARDIAATLVIPSSAPVASVEELHRANEQEEQERRQEALTLIEKGKELEAAGKPNVAIIYYQRAARRADARLRQQIDAHLANLRVAVPRLAVRP